MRISIGILAHNEELVLPRTIESLSGQTLVQNSAPGRHLEVIVVPNGCRDRTADAARQALAKLESAAGGAPILTKVHELAVPGKSRAWKRLVHEFADQQADYLIFIDADVRFGERETLQRLVDALEDNPAASASVDVPLKSLPKPGVWDVATRLSLAASEMARQGPAKIAGSLYCARGAQIRRIWMPIGLPVEDGFVKGMLNTEFFTVKGGPSRVIRVDGATHYFEPQTRVGTVLRHEQRMIVGTVVNTLLYSLLWSKGGTVDVGQMIKELNAADPSWLSKLCNAELEKRGFWRIPRGMVLRRMRQLRQYGVLEALLRMPVAAAGTALTIAASVAANKTLRSGSAVGFW